MHEKQCAGRALPMMRYISVLVAKMSACVTAQLVAARTHTSGPRPDHCARSARTEKTYSASPSASGVYDAVNRELPRLDHLRESYVADDAAERGAGRAMRFMVSSRPVILAMATLPLGISLTFASCPAPRPTQNPATPLVRYLDRQQRVRGSFIIAFKNTAELSCISRRELISLDVAPGLLPDTPTHALELAKALVRSVGVRLEFFYKNMTPNAGFAVTNASDSAAETLARDPRVKDVQASLPLKLD